MPAQSGGRRTLVDTTTCGDPGCERTSIGCGRIIDLRLTVRIYPERALRALSSSAAYQACHQSVRADLLISSDRAPGLQARERREGRRLTHSCLHDTRTRTAVPR